MMIDVIDLQNAAAAGIGWLKTRRPSTVKDLSRAVQALALWNETTSDLIEILVSKKKGSFWETDRPVLDTARACSALAGCGVIHSDTFDWLMEQQKSGCWNNSEIDTSYALIALADAGMKNEEGCEWLFRNYGGKWEHVGTTSLLITALMKQDKNEYVEFIKERTGWLLSKRQDGGWTYAATSNLAVQALMLAEEDDIAPSIDWLLEKQESGNWGDVISTSLSLISLRMYLCYYYKKDP